MVSISTLTTNVWDTLYNHLQTGTYAISTNNIYSAYNDRILETTALPIVIVYPPSIVMSQLTNSTMYAKVSFTIEVYHKSAESLKTLTDDIINKIKTGYSVFSNAGLRKDRANWIESLDYSSWERGENHRLHRNTIAINFRFTGA